MHLEINITLPKHDMFLYETFKAQLRLTKIEVFHVLICVDADVDTSLFS